nr:uncharacterized protein LOC111834249 isoform X2 [Paramormyrops kingsleyae]XP_023649102.1 uncharacterized protein LOC111834249 isoform X2 [Paramormyrops kingsleyae]
MINSVLQKTRQYFCGILNCTCVRSFIRAICGIHPFWRRSVCGGIILCCIYHRRTYLLGGIRWMWQGIEHCCTSFFHHLCRTYNYIRRTLAFPGLDAGAAVSAGTPRLPSPRPLPPAPPGESPGVLNPAERPSSFIMIIINIILNVWRIVREFFFPSPVKVHVLVAGETFQTQDTFIQKLKLQIEPCSAESSSIILVFCPVVSRIGTDMEAAMARVTEDKPVILVFMHHCHDPSHMTNITVQPTESKIVLVVHSVFLENKGLLACEENNQAVVMVCSELKKYK